MSIISEVNNIQWKRIVTTKHADLVADLEVSNTGQVRTVVSKKIFAQQYKDNNAYIMRKKQRIMIKRLIIETFIRPLVEKETIQCIDKDYKNLNLSNLCIITPTNISSNEIIENTAPLLLPKCLTEIETKLSEITNIIQYLKTHVNPPVSVVDEQKCCDMCCTIDNGEVIPLYGKIGRYYAGDDCHIPCPECS